MINIALTIVGGINIFKNKMEQKALAFTFKHQHHHCVWDKKVNAFFYFFFGHF